MYSRHTCLTLILIVAIPATCESKRQPACKPAEAFARAERSLADRRYQEAAGTLDRVRICTGLAAEEAFELGWLYGRARKFETALQVFATVPPEIPDPATHAYAIALSQFELADYDRTILTLRDVQSKLALDNKSANLLAVSLSKRGLYRDAYDVLSDQVRRNPADLTSYLNLVTICAEGGDVKAATDVAYRATQLFPKSPDVFIVHGAANTLSGHLHEASDDFERSLALAPERADSYFFLALARYKQGRFPEAASILKGAVEQKIQDGDLHYLLAECLLKIDAADTQAALHELAMAIDLNPRSASARTLLGKLLLETGHPDKAATELEAAYQQEPDSRSAAYNLAKAYQVLGRGGKARSIFKQLRDQPSNTLVEMGDRRLNDALSGKGTQLP